MSHLSNSDVIIIAFLIPTFLWAVWAIGSNLFGVMSKETNKTMAVRNKK